MAASVIASVGLIYYMLKPDQNLILESVSLSLAAGGLVASVTALLFAQRNQTSVRAVRVALAGSSGAGKTVYANLASVILTEVGLHGLEFTATTRTIQRVSRLIQGLHQGEWPGSTTSDGLNLYQGTIELRRTALQRVLTGSIEVDLEIADAAGDLWDELAELEGGMHLLADRGLDMRNSNFFEYVANSSAVLFFIPADALQVKPGWVKVQVDHLNSLVATLIDAQRFSTHERRTRYVLVVSKGDLLSMDEIKVLRDLAIPDREFSLKLAVQTSRISLSEPFKASIEQLERFLAFADRRSIDATIRTVSAIGSAVGQGALIPEELKVLGIDDQRLEQASQSLPELMGPVAVLRPIEWVLGKARVR